MLLVRYKRFENSRTDMSDINSDVEFIKTYTNPNNKKQ